MKPNNDFLLRAIATSLAREFYPLVESDYHKATLTQIIQLLVGLSAEVDQTASRLLEEIGQMRAIFANAVECVTDTDLKAKLSEAAGSTDTDFKVSALDITSQGMNKLLIELHTHLESLEGDDAKRVEDSLWNELMMKPLRRLPAIMEIATYAELMEET